MQEKYILGTRLSKWVHPSINIDIKIYFYLHARINDGANIVTKLVTESFGTAVTSCYHGCTRASAFCRVGMVRSALHPTPHTLPSSHSALTTEQGATATATGRNRKEEHKKKVAGVGDGARKRGRERGGERASERERGGERASERERGSTRGGGGYSHAAWSSSSDQAHTAQPPTSPPPSLSLSSNPSVCSCRTEAPWHTVRGRSTTDGDREREGGNIQSVRKNKRDDAENVRSVREGEASG